MRGLHSAGELNGLQSKFYASNKEMEELYNLENDPFETINLINDPTYSNVLKKMKGHFNDWNNKNIDHGLNPINWKNTTPPKAPNVLKWLEQEKPEIIIQMQKGIEPGFGKLKQEYQKTN